MELVDLTDAPNGSFDMIIFEPITNALIEFSQIVDSFNRTYAIINGELNSFLVKHIRLQSVTRPYIRAQLSSISLLRQSS